MNNLFILNENLLNGYRFEVLNIITFFAILSSIFVIISKNPIVSVLFLIGLFGNVSSYLIITGLGFIGLSYLIVYIGAISILFLFILMLINVRISELQNNTSNSIPLGIIITLLFNYLLFPLLPYNINFKTGILHLNNIFYDILFPNKLANGSTLDNINIYNVDVSFVTSNRWDGNMSETSHITTIGNILYTNYNIWILLASLILLLAMTGAIVITIKQRD